MTMWSSIRGWARALKRETLVVYHAARDPRTPLVVRGLALLVAAYALSPIDLIPDFIPVLGYLDDVLIVPLGVALVLRLAPEDVMVAARAKAVLAAERPTSRGMAVLIVLAWLAALGWAGHWSYMRFMG